MFREIKKKQIILENRKPYRPEIQRYIQELNTLDWIAGSMRLDGSQMGRKQVERVLKGEFLENCSLMEHGFVERHHRLVAFAREAREMSYTFNPDLLLAFLKKLSDGPAAGYRRDNPVLIALDYNPPHPSEIEEQLALLMNWFYADDEDANPIRKAVVLHHRIIEIYPFESHSEPVARAALHYYLMEKGFPAFEIDLDERAYHEAIIAYLKKGNVEPLYQAVERSLFKKMEVLMQLTMD